MGITIDRWGPSAWNVLHSFAHCAQVSLDRDEQEEWKAFLHAFGRRLPCPTCRAHFKAYLDANVQDGATFAGRESIVAFMNDVHNDVNRRLGKPTWTLEQHKQAYSRPTGGRTDAAATHCGAAIVLAMIVVVLMTRRTAKKSCMVRQL